MERINKYDTLKGILIFTVLLGHIFLKIGSDLAGSFIVFFIQAFHMPLFMTIAGRFAKFKPIDALFYAVMFVVFDAWFVLACGVYYLLVPLFARITDKRGQMALISASLIIGLLWGFVPIVSAPLHRLFTFLPYFLVGYYRVFECKPLQHKWLTLTIATILTLISPFVLNKSIAPTFMCDAYGQHHLWQRIIVYITGMLWVRWMLHVTTNRTIPIVTKIGQSTLWIYLLHQPMIPLVNDLTQHLVNVVSIPMCIVEITVALVWVILLWPVAYGLNKWSRWLFRQWKPLNIKMQERCMPK